MAQLNFPQDRTELVPPGTGPLETGDTYTDAGTTWVYNADAGVWGSGQGSVTNETYLRLDASNDPVTGTCEFEAGVSVTGGTAADVGKGFYTPTSGNSNLDVAVNSLINARFANSVSEPGGRRNFTGFTSYAYNGITESAEIVYGNISQFQGGDYSSTNNLVGYYTKKAKEDTVTGRVVSFKGFEVGQDAGIVADFANSSYGFYSNLNSTDRDTFNFFAAGNAPNYFAGLTQHASGVEARGQVPGSQNLFSVPNSAVVTGSLIGYRFGNTTAPTNATSTGFLAVTSSPDCKTSNGFHAQIGIGNSTDSSKGFLSSLAADGDKNFNFYAAGNAPSYFNGGIVLGDDPNSPSNLKTYEFGTWTPGFRLTTDAGSFTYSIQSGSYTKVGRLVTCQGQITCTGKTGMTSAPLRITGFPFPALNNGQHRDCGTVSIWQGFDDIRFPNAGIIMNNSVNEAELQCGTGGSTTANVRGQDFTSSTTRINFSITYTANS